ncbi:efflux RND transporter periplasmic adaptor subunit [Streptomyces tauricus]|uniref:hypothetical protein n=1 Tax=Streptomyces tauricus TaxID=68274 RepID=UPI002242CC00|nr:hypothetical protein [Streptomyces tauricus]MCW8103322.1 hypothetical protein [Streptomyces tauricus]
MRDRTSRIRRRVLATTLVLGVVVGGAYGAQALSARGEAHKPEAAGPPSALTTPVKRMDLSDEETLPGTLGFGPPYAVKAAGKGTVTRLPATGKVVSRGKPLYWVDDRPVMVFFGDTPMFRTLDKPGLVGRDVTVLAENLRALGYDLDRQGPQQLPQPSRTTNGAAVGTELTPGLLAALKRWQRDTGQQQTGTLELGRVVVLSGSSRVGSLTAQLGDPVPADVLGVTSARKAIDVKVDAQSADSIHQGDKVRISLPDDRVVAGKVVQVATEVQGGGSEEEVSGAESSPTLRVVVEPDDADDVEKLDAASVQVSFTAQRHSDVLAVPVGALLALSEGGYALQRPDGQLVSVKTGLIVKGMAEVSGTGIKDGELVVTAS